MIDAESTRTTGSTSSAIRSVQRQRELLQPHAHDLKRRLRRNCESGNRDKQIVTGYSLTFSPISSSSSPAAFAGRGSEALKRVTLSNGRYLPAESDRMVLSGGVVSEGQRYSLDPRFLQIAIVFGEGISRLPAWCLHKKNTAGPCHNSRYSAMLPAAGDGLQSRYPNPAGHPPRARLPAHK
jgi:hypothetical protein